MSDFEKLYNIALRFLSYRPRSEKEIRDKLLRKKAPKEIIEKIIEKLKEKKFINDEEFGRWWIENRLRFKPQGIRLTELELRNKGIDKELIDRIIHNSSIRQAQDDPENTEGSEFIIQSDLEQAKKLVEKKIVRFKGLSRKEIYQKVGRFLAPKGFDWDTIKQSIDEVLLKGV